MHSAGQGRERFCVGNFARLANAMQTLSQTQVTPSEKAKCNQRPSLHFTINVKGRYVHLCYGFRKHPASMSRKGRKFCIDIFKLSCNSLIVIENLHSALSLSLHEYLCTWYNAKWTKGSITTPTHPPQEVNLCLSSIH